MTRSERLKARRRMQRRIRLVVEERRLARSMRSGQPGQTAPTAPAEPAV